MAEHGRAKRWREDRGLTLDHLADLTGYTRQTIYWMERGQSPPNAHRKKPTKVSPWIWQRYKMMCAGVEAQLQSGTKFTWGK